MSQSRESANTLFLFIRSIVSTATWELNITPTGNGLLKNIESFSLNALGTF
jgi:hypothetical protein